MQRNSNNPVLKKIVLFPVLLLLIADLTHAQSAYEDVDGAAYDLVNRLSTLSGELPQGIHTTVQPLDKKSIAGFMEQAAQYNTRRGWTQTDNANIGLALSNAGEWAAPDGFGAIDSRRPAGPFYQKITDLAYYNNRDFFISANPVLGFQGIYENADEATDFKYNIAAGAKVRAKYKDYVGLDLNIRYIREQPVSYYEDLNNSRNTLIGGPRNYNYNSEEQSYSYLLPTGNISVSLLRDYISLNLGYDYLKLGDGYRGLVLSDFAAPVAYANIRTKVWKLQYDNIFMKLNPDTNIPGNPLTNVQPNYKFATAHQLSVNLTKWLNVGAYEMVVFSRENGFEMGYLNPIIFYRAIERGLGSPDKVTIGINAKAIAAKGLRFYGQFLLNEFTAKEFFAGNGYIHNKWGAQLGLNYYDAFNISNLDLQLEGNVIRPYTFQHIDRGAGYVAANFTNNNLPLGHPLAAGFREAIFIATYRPAKNITLEGKAMFYQHGVDTGGLNLGNDPSKDYSKNYPADHGIKMVNGPKLTRLLGSLRASYQIAPNLFFDLGGVYGNFNYAALPASNSSHYHIYSGIRLNLAHRDYTKI